MNPLVRAAYAAKPGRDPAIRRSVIRWPVPRVKTNVISSGDTTVTS